MNLSIKLVGGEAIHLQSLLLLDTYSGFLEGEILEANKRLLLRYLNTPRKLWPDVPVHCINSNAFEQWTKSKFPEIQCCGEFLSYKPVHDKSMHASTLIIVWFQDDIYPTVSGENQRLLENLNWGKYALDLEW